MCSLRSPAPRCPDDLRYRVSRVKARLKFMIDDIGPEGMRERVESRLGRTLEGYALPPADTVPHDHMGVHEQRQPGLSYIGVPVQLGLISGDQLIAIADVAAPLGADIRITRQQNLIVANVPVGQLETVVAGLAGIGFPVDASRLRATSIACTGEPHCNFSVTETKTRLDRLVRGLEERFGDDVGGLRLHLDGCPHACAQHWVGDLGFQGTTARDEAGERQQAYDIFVRGGLGPDAAVGRPPVPARAHRQPRRGRPRPRRRLARRARAGRGVRPVLAPPDGRATGCPGRPGAGEAACTRGGGGLTPMSFEAWPCATRR